MSESPLTGISTAATPINADVAGKATSSRYIRPARKLPFGNQLAYSVSNDSVAAAHCVQLPGCRKLAAVRKEYLPRNAASPEMRKQQITGIIEEMYHQMGGRWKSVALTIGGSETAYRRLQIPRLGKRELKSAIPIEIKRQIPFPVADACFDYRPIAEVSVGTESQFKIAVTAATRHLVDQHLEPFNTLGITVDAIYLATDVVGRLLEGLPQFDPDANYCLVNIERTHSEISYYRGTELEFSHVISLGSQFLANRRDDTVFAYFTESLIGELQNSVDFYSGQFAARFSNEVYIYGDLSYTDELIDRLNNHVEFAFHRFPTELIHTVQFRTEDVRLTAPVCLPAVAAAVNNLAIPNLLPEAQKRTSASRRVDRWAMMSVGSMVIFLLGTWVASRSSIADSESRLAAMNGEIDQFRSSSLYVSYDSLKQQMAFDQAYLNKSKASPSFVSSGLKELSILAPAEVRLYDYAVTAAAPDKNGRLAGIVKSASTPPEVILAEFVERLRQSPVFRHVTVDSYQKKIESGVATLLFQISMTERI
jgi:hypothetical protein